MTKTLTTVFALALASLACAAQAQAIKGDPKEGEKKNAMCIGCHGIDRYQASFPQVYKVPMIGGQNEAYIVAALQAYKKGERKHPTMRAIAASLEEKDMINLAAYYSVQGQTAPKATVALAPDSPVPALLNKGICASCHGEGFQKPISDSIPKVAGQYSDYLFASLKAYQTDSNNRYIGRTPGLMAQPLEKIKDHNVSGDINNLNDLRLLADYIASQPSELRTVPERHFRIGQK